MALRHEITAFFCYSGYEPSGFTNGPVDQINSCSSKTMYHTTIQLVAQPVIRWPLKSAKSLSQQQANASQSVSQSVSQPLSQSVSQELSLM
jgi:subtilase family serine protease